MADVQPTDPAAEARALLDAIENEVFDGFDFLQRKYLPRHSPHAVRLVLMTVLIDLAGKYGAVVMEQDPILTPTVHALVDSLVMYLAPTGRPQ
jgi:hypothetical protein